MWILFQEDLDRVAESWDNHRMRPDRAVHRQQGGRLIPLYTVPELCGLENKMVAVHMSEVAECQAESIAKGECPCETPEIF